MVFQAASECGIWKQDAGLDMAPCRAPFRAPLMFLHSLDWFTSFTIYSQAPLKKLPVDKLLQKEEEFEEEKPEKEELDWWSKYYESLKELSNQVMHLFYNYSISSQLVLTVLTESYHAKQQLGFSSFFSFW